MRLFKRSNAPAAAETVKEYSRNGFVHPFAQETVAAWFAANPRCAYVVAEFDAADMAQFQAFCQDMLFNGVPAEARAIVESWAVFSKSPYSFSFYNSTEITWESKPEGSLRLSDHWNFEVGDGRKHCRLNTTAEYLQKTWILARYENGVYIELQRF